MKNKILLSISTILIMILISSILPVSAATYSIGDVNHDGEINIIDATDIQKKLAGISVKKYYSANADFDRSGSVSIADATLIQKYSAGMVSIYGNYFLADNGTTVYMYFGNAASVSVPGNLGITKISPYAFNENNTLQTITLPASVSKIEDYAFYNCSKLTTLYSYNQSLKWGKSFVNCPKFQTIKFL